MQSKKTRGLLFQFSVIFSIFTVITLILGGVCSYLLQMRFYTVYMADSALKMRETSAINREILENVLLQVAGIGLIMIAGFLCVLYFMGRHQISRIRRLTKHIEQYTQDKNVSVAHAIEQESAGKDEIDELSSQTAAMILELENHINNLAAATGELSKTKEGAGSMSRLAKKDTLTSVWNKMAFDSETERLESQLAEGKTKLGFAMIDMNFLGRINNSFGHENGNAAIRNLSHIICHVFVHSPVYRIGGDKFAVLLKNDDYHNAEELVKLFEQKITETVENTALKPWEQVSAAIGYALYDRTRDSSAADVMKRAEKAMRLQKSAMKAVRVNYIPRPGQEM